MVSANAFPRGPLLVALLLTVVGAAAFAGTGWYARSGASPLTGRYTPDAGVPRIAFDGVPVDAMLVVDFDVLNGEIYLLDAGASRVTVLSDSAGRFRTARSFGRSGGGPGEVTAPSGIATLPLTGEVVIADRHLLHYFTTAGAYVRTRAPAMPCTLSQARVTDAGEALLLTGRCVRSDSVVAELFWLPAQPVFERATARDSVIRVADEPLYTMTGGGATLSAPSLLSTGSGRALFGGGGSDCIDRIELGVRPPVSSHMCSIAAAAYPFVPDADLVARSRAMASAKPWAAKSFELPDRLPYYVGSLVWNDLDVLIRPFNADSVVFRLAGDEADIAVAGLNDLVGCRPTGCLWLRNDAAPEVMFVPIERIFSRELVP